MIKKIHTCWRSRADVFPLQDFAYQDEATALFARMTAAPYDGRKYGINHFVRRLKNAGLWGKVGAGWLLAAPNEQSSLLNFTADQFNAAKVSTPTFTADRGWLATGTGTYIDTGWNPSTAAGVSASDFHFALYSSTAELSGDNDGGVVVGGNGISLNVGTAAGRISFRANGAPTTTSTGGLVNGFGLTLVSVSGSVASVYRDGELVEEIAYAPTGLVNGNLYLLRPNGQINYALRRLSFASVGQSMTAAQARDYFAIVNTYVDSSRGGWPNIHDAECSPYSINADVIVYGATLQGCVAAYEASRQGKTVAIVGGWRERHLGGVTTSGLAVMDVDNPGSVGGLARVFASQVSVEIGDSPSSNPNFQSRFSEFILRRWFDSTRTGGRDVPIYWTRGVKSVTKIGTRLASLTTVDRKNFSGSQFIDATYEGDLLALAGCSNIVGREAAGTGNEAWSGERGTTTTQNGSQSQYSLNHAAPFYNIDPYVEPGNPASGRLFGVNAPSGIAVGTADSKIQAYNFRITVTSQKVHGLTPGSAQPADFVLSRYEPLLRFLAALTGAGKVYGTDYSLSNLLYFVAFGSASFQYYDVNQFCGFGPNFYGQNWAYPTANYAAREVIWKAHEAHVRGLWYVLRYGRSIEGDTRIPAQLETDARAWCFDRKHYTDPHPNDDLQWPYQLYVRQARRLVGDFVYDANDLGAADGSAPRSVKTIGCASYNIDPHHVEAIADPNGGTPRIWNTGMVVVGVNGLNQRSPLPYEIVLPKSAEVTNLLVPFCVSATHLAFGSIRMELATSALAQACGMAAAIAIENSNQDVQSVDYTTLRTRLLASPSLANEVAPVIPQTN